MQAVILCGGEGTRIRDHTVMPKALIDIGGKPILWHIMKYYSCHGVNDFVLCLGYRADTIREAFKNNSEGWNIEFADTGEKTNKGQRLKMVENYIKGDTFLVAYGDDLSDVDINQVIDFHKSHGRIATLTAVNPTSQFGVIEFHDNGMIIHFKEKPKLDRWINGGFFVFDKKIFGKIKEGWDLEVETFEDLAKSGDVYAFQHSGFWGCMNTFKDLVELNALWNSGNAPWKKW